MSGQYRAKDTQPLELGDDEVENIPESEPTLTLEVLHRSMTLGFQGVNARLKNLQGDVMDIRKFVLSDMAPRVTAVEAERRSIPVIARGVSLTAGKYTGALLVVGMLGRFAAKQWPEFGAAIEGILVAMGL